MEPTKTENKPKEEVKLSDLLKLVIYGAMLYWGVTHIATMFHS
jgi:hypothetical protein